MGQLKNKGVLEAWPPTARPLPVLYSIPHAGRDYPDDFRPALAPEILRGAEDAYVDLLLEDAPSQGITVLKALFPRSYLDVNRSEDDLDPQLFSPGTVAEPGPKSALGIGLIRRVVTPGFAIYDRTLSLEEVRARVETCYRPYHDAMGQVLAEIGTHSDPVLFIDWHSMKSVGNAATPDGEGAERADFVLGDATGDSCHPGLTEAVAAYLGGRGYRVAVNDPYAGGTVLRRHSRPAKGIHGLQIEINRALYLDEATLSLTDRASELKDVFAQLVPVLAAWASEARP